ncbi:MAG TPA: cupin domain-containing protein [Chloroflexota bacterium]|nr:cupin domain-containing protein [Chloroflexota bacterium]
MAVTRFLIDTYLDWVAGEGVPVLEDFGFDLLAVETAAWPRMGGGARGAYVHVKGRGDFVNAYVCELAPGGQTEPQQHLFEEVVYVLSGRGSTTIRTAAGARHSFEWGTGSLFALPLNTGYQHFNTSGRDPARFAAVTSLPLVLNAFHNERFVFDNPWDFSDRHGEERFFRGEGEFLPVRPGRHQWQTNFVPDLRTFQLQAWEQRGIGSSNIKFILADGTMHAHMSELAVGAYKKAHRHGPDFHIFPVTGQGYSLLWYAGEQEFRRIDWQHGSLYAPPDQMFHQHFNTAPYPSRYLAVAFGSIRYPFVSDKKALFGDAGDKDVAQGGRQIEYEDEDPRVRAIFEAALATHEVEVDPRLREVWARAEGPRREVAAAPG